MTEICKEYAEALFMLASEEKDPRAVMASLERADEAFSQNPDYLDLLASPGISLRERLESIRTVFGESLHPHVQSMIGLLCEKGRIRMFHTCVEEYRALMQLHNKVTTAKVVSAVALTDRERDALKQKLERISRKTVILECSVDPSLLGGVTVEMNGTVMDGSLRHRLREVKDVMNR